jgi:glycerate dehydrogenase
MEIVITDGYTLNPGDLSWKPFSELGTIHYFDRSSAIEMPVRCYNADIIITNKTPVGADVMESASNLKMIAVTATGYNNIDLAAANKKDITVCNVPAYGTFSVAQHVFGLLLHLTNHVSMNAASVASGEWEVAKDWCYTLQPIMELKDKVMGIVGLGRIGKQVAVIAKAFGMKVIYYGGRDQLENTQSVSLHELFMKSDVVSLHCPLTKDNKGFINKELLGLMKRTAFLINTSRGPLINEKDLGLALHQGRLAAAALDVLTKEPPEKNHPLIGIKNCIITPHTAWISTEARSRLMQVTLENIRAFLKGTPQNVVNR